MNLCLNVLILLSLAFWANALVYYTKMDKGANGCKPKSGKEKITRTDTATGDTATSGTATGDTATSGTEIKVGEFAKDPNTCGVNVCQNTEGDAIVLYCQKPAPFEQCNTDGVSIGTPFPECCWKCVAYTSCADGSGDGSGAGGGAGGNGAANGAANGDANGAGESTSTSETPPSESYRRAKAITPAWNWKPKKGKKI